MIAIRALPQPSGYVASPPGVSLLQTHLENGATRFVKGGMEDKTAYLSQNRHRVQFLNMLRKWYSCFLYNETLLLTAVAYCLEMKPSKLLLRNIMKSSNPRAF